MRILFLSRWFPFPPNNGSKLRIFNLLKGLAQHNEITLISYFAESEGLPHVKNLQDICSQIYPIAYNGFDISSFKNLIGFLRATPRSVQITYSIELEKLIKNVLDTKEFDLVIASQFDMAIYAQSFGGLPAIFEEVESGVYYERASQKSTRRQRFRQKLTWFKHRHYLLRLLRFYQACTVVSEQERRILQHTTPNGPVIKIIPNCIDLKSYEPFQKEQQPNTMVFTGSLKFGPNYEAMLWFLQDVFPIVQSHIPSVKLIITGDTGGKPLPPGENIHLSGFVNDVKPIISSASVSLAPIWTGGGTRLKILEAMALHTPVVATTKGAEGLDVRHNEHLLIANNPDCFAGAITDLLQDPDLNKRIANNAYQLITHKYNWDVVMPQYLRFIEGLVK